MVQMVRGQASCLSGSIIEWEMHLAHNTLSWNSVVHYFFFFFWHVKSCMLKKKRALIGVSCEFGTVAMFLEAGQVTYAESCEFSLQRAGPLLGKDP